VVEGDRLSLWHTIELLDVTALGLRGLPQADPLAGTRQRHDADQPELF
jgi:hypothetical protein